MAGSTGNSTNSGGWGGNRGGSSSPSNPANASIFAARKLATEQQIKIYAASLCGLMAVFVLFHWTRWLCTRVERSLNSGKTPVLGQPFVKGSR